MDQYTGRDVTVLMSVYKNTILNELTSALSSITVQQTVPPRFVVIVIDGPVSNEILSYLNNLPEEIKTIQLKKNLGLASALAAGMDSVDTKLIARMDSDDFSRPTRIEKQLQMFNEKKNLGVFGGGIREFDNVVGDGNVMRIMPETNVEIRRFMKFRNPFNHPTVMFKKDVVLDAGGYKDLYLFEDYYLWARVAESENIELLNSAEVFVDMRAGSGLYERRGGKRYFNSVIKLRSYMRKSGQISVAEFLIGVGINWVSMKVPTAVRKWIYAVFLREKVV